ncbi:MAG: aldolase catalytic domain-containing protein [Eubacterium sp.]|nr:aldolase catalytic domain-containing protein [Eubacterium sp.]
MSKINLLDCTLRDGGYLNDWEFGHDNIVNIFERLVSAGLDIIEIGFIDEARRYDANRTIFPDAASVNRTYKGLSKGSSMIVGMIDYGTCGIDKMIPAAESFMDGIRIIFKKEKKEGAIAFCRQVKELGYKVFAQAVSITSYDDAELMDLLGLVNDLEPYAFSLVDTYGLLHKNRLMHYFEFVNQHMKTTIGLGYHSHNNFQLAYANCIEVMELSDVERAVVIDGTLYGMGKSAGNAPLELLAAYMNDNLGKHYHCSQLLEAIDVTMLELYKQIPWGYSFKFFLSASKDCHPNYVTYLMDKKKLSVKSINEILDKLEDGKKLLYDRDYAERLYVEYQKTECDDSKDRAHLRNWLRDREVMLLAPGKNIVEQSGRIKEYLAEKGAEDIVKIAINFVPAGIPVDAVFISNAKRYVPLSTKLSQSENKLTTLATSNVTKASGSFDYVFNYSALLDEQALIVDNPMIMLFKLLREAGVAHVSLAGFDGYVKADAPNYVNPNMDHSFSREKAQEINRDVVDSIKRLGALEFAMEYITDTLYQS